MKYWIALPLAVVLLAIGLFALSTAPSEGGPLAAEVAPNAVTFSVTPGASFTYGGIQLRSPLSAGTVTLEGVRLEAASRGLEVVNAYVLSIPETDGGLWFSYESFPPPGVRINALQPLGGYRLGPETGEIQVLLALMVPADGTYEFRRITVAYELKGRRYEETLPFAMRVCAPMVQLGGCSPIEPAANAWASRVTSSVPCLRLRERA